MIFFHKKDQERKENIKISEVLGTREVGIPETDVVVKIRDISWPDFMESLEIENEKDRGIFTVCKVIADWNITDDEGKKMEVNEENIKKLSAKIVMPLISIVQEVFDSQKKKK